MYTNIKLICRTKVEIKILLNHTGSNLITVIFKWHMHNYPHEHQHFPKNLSYTCLKYNYITANRTKF